MRPLNLVSILLVLPSLVSFVDAFIPPHLIAEFFRHGAAHGAAHAARGAAHGAAHGAAAHSAAAAAHTAAHSMAHEMMGDVLEEATGLPLNVLQGHGMMQYIHKTVTERLKDDIMKETG